MEPKISKGALVATLAGNTLAQAAATDSAMLRQTFALAVGTEQGPAERQ